MRLFGSPFSPFARKVAMVLEHKGIAHEYIDGASPQGHEELAKLNRRREVPVLDHDGLVVCNSSDIVAYLDHQFPEMPVLPADPADRVSARALERLSDGTVDAILVDISLWGWANRPDQMPEGLLEAARNDLDVIYQQLEAALGGKSYFVGEELTIADFALFPHLSAATPLKVPIDRARFPKLGAWLKRMLAHPITKIDMDRLREYMPNRAERGLEMDRIAWRGDRLEWILAKGFHDWFLREIEENRVIWPV